VASDPHVIALPGVLVDRDLVLADPWPVPAADVHPVLVYLGRLAPSGRRGQATGLERIAAFLSDGRLDPESLPWPRLRYQHVRRVHTWLAHEAMTETNPPRRMSPGTANTYLAALRGVLKESWRLGYMTAEDHNRAVDVEKIKGSRELRGRALKRGEAIAVFEHLADTDALTARRDAALVALMYSSGGVRRSEAVSLDLEHLDEGSRRLRVIGKGNKERVLYLVPEVMDALREWLDIRGRQPGPLFLPIAKSRTEVEWRRLSVSTVRQISERRSVQAGVARFSPHDLRRTSISDLLTNTGDISTVSKVAGHESIETTRKYDRRDEAVMQRAAETLHVPFVSRRSRQSPTPGEPMNHPAPPSRRTPPRRNAVAKEGDAP
jgi:integrase